MITAMAPMAELTTALADAITTVSEAARQRTDGLRQLARTVSELTLQVRVPSETLAQFRAAHDRLRALPEPPVRPPATRQSVEAAREADGRAAYPADAPWPTC